MISWLFISLVITILLTPGPTNTLASSGIESGVKKSIKLIPAEAMGYFIAISLWGILPILWQPLIQSTPQFLSS